MRMKVPGTAIAASLVVLCAGCTTVYTGVGVRDPHADSGGVNTSLLDTGNFPTTPREPLGAATSREQGALVEARRMADAVTLAFEADPTLDAQGDNSGPFIDGSIPRSENYDNSAIGDAIDAHDFVAGFRTNGVQSKIGLTKITHYVLRFASPKEADAALADMVDHSERDADGSIKARSALPIPDRPDTRAFVVQSDSWVDTYAYTAHGPYVLVDKITIDNTDAAIKLTLAMVDKQIPALDGFTPTPVDQIATLPLDPTGLEAKTLPVPKNARNTEAVGTYGTHGALHFMLRPVRNQKLFDDTGMSTMSLSITTVYQTRDAAAATQVADDIATQISELKYPAYALDDPISGMPGARCLKPDDDSFKPKFRCVTHLDRYVIESSHPSSIEARRSLAAQYAMLAAQ